MLDSRIMIDDNDVVIDSFVDNLQDKIYNLENQIDDLKKTQKRSSGRKDQVLSLLKDYESISILQISEMLSISTKNVSSQLTYLRSDGHKIFTDENGRKVLMNQDN